MRRALLLAERLLMEEQYKLSSTQINLPEATGDFLLKWGRTLIPTEDLFYDDKGGCGRETEMHVTVLYGLTDPEPPAELRRLVNKTRPFTVSLGNVSVFENEKYDVLKVEVHSEDLVKLSNAIRVACDNENKFPKYIPHCTLAYVKKGRCKDVVGMNPFDNDAPVEPSFDVNEIMFKGAGDSEDPERVVARLPFDRYTKEAEDPKNVFRQLTSLDAETELRDMVAHDPVRFVSVHTAINNTLFLGIETNSGHVRMDIGPFRRDQLVMFRDEWYAFWKAKWSGWAVAMRQAGLAEAEQSPFDNLPFPSEASVLAAKLLELSTAQKPGLL